MSVLLVSLEAGVKEAIWWISDEVQMDDVRNGSWPQKWQLRIQRASGLFDLNLKQLRNCVCVCVFVDEEWVVFIWLWSVNLLNFVELYCRREKVRAVMVLYSFSLCVGGCSGWSNLEALSGTIYHETDCCNETTWNEHLVGKYWHHCSGVVKCIDLSCPFFAQMYDSFTGWLVWLMLEPQQLVHAVWRAARNSSARLLV